jgi:hypothetical protein
MKTKLKSLTITCGLIASFGVIPFFASAQDSTVEAPIEIINQDGEKVAPAKIQIRQQQDQASAKATARAGVSFQNKDGKIIIVDADGTKREIDVQGAQSIIVNQSVKSIMKDGEEKTEAFGKAIIIGPDGKRQEIELGAPGVNVPGMNLQELNLQGLNFPGFDGVIKVDRLDNKFMIGVNCEPVSEALSTQLKLESGTGLVVNHIGPGTPAEASGIQLHDILMFADDRQLAKPSDLVEAVQIAGKEKTKMTLTVVRAGKEIGISVMPTERPANAAGIGPGFQQRFVLPNVNGRGFDMKFKQMGPGVIIGDDLQQELELNLADQMKEMRVQMEELKKQMKEQLESGK